MIGSESAQPPSKRVVLTPNLRPTGKILNERAKRIVVTSGVHVSYVDEEEDVAQLAYVQLTGDQIMGLLADDFEIIPAPGAGNMVRVIDVTFRLLMGDTTFDGDVDINMSFMALKGANDPQASVNLLGFTNGVANPPWSQNQNTWDPAAWQDTSIVLWASPGSYQLTEGNGTLDVWVLYYIATTDVPPVLGLTTGGASNG